MQMEYVLRAENLDFSYRLVDLQTFPYQIFLASDRTEEVVLAVLADFAGEPEALVAEKIIAKLKMLSQGKLELSQRTRQLVRLSTLRHLSTTVLNVAQQMALDIDITEDALYLLGIEKGEQKGLEKGKVEIALNLLKKGMAAEFVSEATQLPAERIAQLKQQLEAGQ
jgi:predicted transposase/invertase (TIGR01784 family)